MRDRLPHSGSSGSAAPVDAGCAAAPERAGGVSRRKTVLIIDDNEMLASVAKAILERFGRTVHTVHTGALGRSLAVRIQPDVVICDIDLPDESGFDVLAALRATPAASNAPFVFFSGRADMDREHCRTLGASAVLSKPCLFSELNRTIEELMRASERTCAPAA